MLVTGDLKCLHCGFISGRWVGQNGAPLSHSGLKPDLLRPPALESTDPEGLVRCGRCDGPVFLDDVGMVISSTRLRRIRRLREQIASFDGRGRGRAA